MCVIEREARAIANAIHPTTSMHRNWDVAGVWLACQSGGYKQYKTFPTSPGHILESAEVSTSIQNDLIQHPQLILVAKWHCC